MTNYLGKPGSLDGPPREPNKIAVRIGHVIGFALAALTAVTIGFIAVAAVVWTIRGLIALAHVTF